MTKKKKIITWGVTLATVAAVAIPVSLYLTSNNKNYKKGGNVNFGIAQKFDDSAYHYNPPVIPQHWMNMDYDPQTYDQMLKEDCDNIKIDSEQTSKANGESIVYKDDHNTWTFDEQQANIIGKENIPNLIKDFLSMMNFNRLGGIGTLLSNKQRTHLRGQGMQANKSIDMIYDERNSLQSLKEVFAHEYGHYLDTFLLKSPLNKDDEGMSYKYYLKSANFNELLQKFETKSLNEPNRAEETNQFLTMKPWLTEKQMENMKNSNPSTINKYLGEAIYEEFATMSVAPYVYSSLDFYGIHQQNYFNTQFGAKFWDINNTAYPFEIYGKYLKYILGVNNWDNLKISKTHDRNKGDQYKLSFNSMSKEYSKKLDHLEVIIGGKKYVLPIESNKYRVAFHWAPVSYESNKLKYIAIGNSGSIDISSFELPTEVKYFDKEGNLITQNNLYISTHDETTWPFNDETYQLNSNNNIEKIEL